MHHFLVASYLSLAANIHSMHWRFLKGLFYTVVYLREIKSVGATACPFAQWNIQVLTKHNIAFAHHLAEVQHTFCGQRDMYVVSVLTFGFHDSAA